MLLSKGRDFITKLDLLCWYSCSWIGKVVQNKSNILQVLYTN